MKKLSFGKLKKFKGFPTPGLQKRTRMLFKPAATAKAILTPVIKKNAPKPAVDAGKKSLKSRFNFDPPKTPLIKVDKRGKFIKLKFSPVIKLNHNYAFWVKGVKHVGRHVDRSNLGKTKVMLQVWIDTGKVKMKRKWFTVPISEVSLDPWDTVGNVPREAPPNIVKFKPDRMERYRRGGGQKLIKGVKTTPYHTT